MSRSHSPRRFSRQPLLCGSLCYPGICVRMRSRGRRHLWDSFWRHAILHRNHVNLFHGEKSAHKYYFCASTLPALTPLVGLSRFVASCGACHGRSLQLFRDHCWCIFCSWTRASRSRSSPSRRHRCVTRPRTCSLHDCGAQWQLNLRYCFS